MLVTAGLRPISVPININMAPGEYYVAFNMSTSQSSVGLSTTALGFSMSHECGLGLSATNYADNFTAVTSSAQGLNILPGCLYDDHGGFAAHDRQYAGCADRRQWWNRG